MMLTDEDIRKIATDVKGDTVWLSKTYLDPYLKVQLKKVVEWLYMPCTEHPVSDVISPMRKDCPKCWQVLLEEVQE